MKVLKLLALLLSPFFLYAQGPIYQKVQDAKGRSTSSEFNLVIAAGTNLRSSGIPANELTEGLLLDLDLSQIDELRSNNSELIRMNLPMPDQSTVIVDLVENKVMADDFIFRESSSRDEISRYTPGKYYHGVINNDPNSLAAISVFENEIIGLINTSRGNYVIGKLKGDTNDKHIIYNDNDLTASNPFECGTEDDGVAYTWEAFQGQGRILNRPVRCVPPEILVDYHTGYTVDENDFHDVKLLCEKFEIDLPSEYLPFLANEGKNSP